jgi:nitrogen fixation/metabolism regulation signal transduction histidine kinase
VKSVRTRLILVFLAATALPLAATWWIAASLFEHSLSYSSTDQLDELSKTLEIAGRELYQRARESLKADAAAGRVLPERASPQSPEVAEFIESGEPERFVLSPGGERLAYYVRRGGEVDLYSAKLGSATLARISDQYRRAREAVDQARTRDLRRGFLYTFLLLAAAVWGVALAALVFMAHQVSRPILRLTAGLERLAAGDLDARVDLQRPDEVGRAVTAFNHMAAELRQSRDRLVYLTQLASWQGLARKMAHELKNSLTPIRLMMEEVLARDGEDDRAFVQQAARIVVDEAETLERRVRAFSEFAAEPPVRPAPMDVNAVVEDRLALLRAGHPELSCSAELAQALPPAQADEDLVKGILTNLLENGADAAGAGGRMLVRTFAGDGVIAIEVHDSGPGLSEQARKSLFEPTITFKKRGMGLGLSIARKNALLLGGDIVLAPGALGGAAFRITLPKNR